MYQAVSVARHIITYCNKQGKPISNLKLQNLLYFVWIEYYRRTNSELFFENIYAWATGPTVPTVYYEFGCFAGLPIRREYAEECTEDARIIDDIVNQYIDIPVAKLVEMTHEDGGSWQAVYQGGIGAKQIIPFSLIKNMKAKRKTVQMRLEYENTILHT